MGAVRLPKILVLTIDRFLSAQTRFHTFRHQDPAHVSAVEFSRHAAWRARGMLDFMLEKVRWGTPPAELAALLRRASAEIERAAKLVAGEEDDILRWVDHESVQSQLEQRPPVPVLPSRAKM